MPIYEYPSLLWITGSYPPLSFLGFSVLTFSLLLEHLFQQYTSTMALFILATLLCHIATSAYGYAVPASQASNGCEWGPEVASLQGGVVSLVESCSESSPIGSKTGLSGVNIPSSGGLSGATIITSRAGTAVVSETFVPSVLSRYSSLASASTIHTVDSENRPTSFVVGPGGVVWSPINTGSTKLGLSPPTMLPSFSGSTVHAASDPDPTKAIVDVHSTSTGISSPDSKTSTTISLRPTNPSAATISHAGGSQSTDVSAFAATAPAVTTISADGLAEVWTKTSFSNLLTITAPTTVTTSVAFTATNGQQSTTLAAVVVGPGGVWWDGESKGVTVGECIWPFCHSEEGEDTSGGGCVWPFCSTGKTGGGGGSAVAPTKPGVGVDPTKPGVGVDPTKPGGVDDPTKPAVSVAPTKPGVGADPTKPAEGDHSTKPSSNKPTSKQTASATSTSECQITRTVSDCSVACSTPTSASTMTCATKCFSTASGCDVTGTTTTTTSSGCSKVMGWSSFSVGPALTLPTISANATSTQPKTTSRSLSSASAKPTCMADGASWYSPTSWCDCGPTGRYSTLKPTAGATTANCAYVSLPSTTIKPVATASEPTNVPGMNGLGACQGIVSSPGTSAYCDCNGTPAATLKPTSSNIMNCAYTVQPTSVYDPKIPSIAPATTVSTAPTSLATPQYAPGQCGIHVWEAHGAYLGDPPVALIVTIKDAKGNVIGQNHSALNWPSLSGDGSRLPTTMTVDSKLPNVLTVTPEQKLNKRGRNVARFAAPIPPWPAYEDSSLEFVYGSEKWLQSDAQCKVGGWDGGDFEDFVEEFLGAKFLLNRQMDCGFPCPAPEEQKRWSIADIEPEREVHFDLQHNASSNHQQLESRGTHSPEWDNAAKKGAQLYQAWKAKTGPDKDALCDLEQRYAELGPYPSKYSNGHNASSGRNSSLYGTTTPMEKKPLDVLPAPQYGEKDDTIHSLAFNHLLRIIPIDSLWLFPRGIANVSLFPSRYQSAAERTQGTLTVSQRGCKLEVLHY